MPFINIKTNVYVSHEQQVGLKSALGQAITDIPGKSESWLMVGIQPEYALWFKGEDSPAAMVEVSIFGGASAGAYTALTADICNIIESELSIPQSRVYIKYTETERWGWNGGNF